MDKVFEKRILELIYPTTLFTVINGQSESPDFQVKSRDGNLFGVEITEHFISESGARLIKNENYLDELLSGIIPGEKKYLNKKDAKRLLKDSVVVLDDQGNAVSKYDVILQHNPSREEFIASIETQIRAKQKKVGHYDKSLNHINLIIYAHHAALNIDGLHQFYQVFYVSSMITALQQSPFDEIFLIMQFPKGQYFIPLKSLLFLSRLRLFDGFCKKRLTDYSATDKWRLFFYFVDQEGFREVRTSEVNQNIEFIYGGTGFMIDFSTSILHHIMYGDSKIESTGFVHEINKLADFIPAPDLFREYQQYLVENLFWAEYGFLCN